MRKSWDNGRNSELNNQLQSGRPVTILYHLSRQEADIFKKVDEFLREP
jgi:hypothetical protein